MYLGWFESFVGLRSRLDVSGDAFLLGEVALDVDSILPVSFLSWWLIHRVVRIEEALTLSPNLHVGHLALLLSRRQRVRSMVHSL